MWIYINRLCCAERVHLDLIQKDLLITFLTYGIMKARYMVLAFHTLDEGVVR